MSAVIYSVLNGAIIKNFKTLGGAKGSLTRMSKKQIVDHFRAVTMEDYDKTGAKIANRMVQVKNCITGDWVEIRTVDVGGPCDPSTENFHCI